jgi:hypothetical protein
VGIRARKVIFSKLLLSFAASGACNLINFLVSRRDSTIISWKIAPAGAIYRRKINTITHLHSTPLWLNFNRFTSGFFIHSFSRLPGPTSIITIFFFFYIYFNFKIKIIKTIETEYHENNNLNYWMRMRENYSYTNQRVPRHNNYDVIS